MIRLTDEQIDTLFEKLKLGILAERKVKRHWWLFPFLWTLELLRDVILLNIETSNAIRDAQLKRVVEWGIESCSEHLPQWEGRVDLMGGVISKRECPKCWQALSDEIPTGDSAAQQSSAGLKGQGLVPGR